MAWINYNIYKNIIESINMQSLNVVSYSQNGEKEILDESQHNKLLSHDDFVMITCDDIVYVHFPKNSKYLNTTSFDRFLSVKLPKTKKAIFLSDPNLSETTIYKKIQLFATENNMSVVCYPEFYFYHVLIAHTNMPSYRIMSEAEKVELLSDLRIDSDDLKKIKQDGVVCAWYGAKVGDILEITELHHDVGQQITYRVVI